MRAAWMRRSLSSSYRLRPATATAPTTQRYLHQYTFTRNQDAAATSTPADAASPSSGKVIDVEGESVVEGEAAAGEEGGVDENAVEAAEVAFFEQDPSAVEIEFTQEDVTALQEEEAALAKGETPAPAEPLTRSQRRHAARKIGEPAKEILDAYNTEFENYLDEVDENGVKEEDAEDEAAMEEALFNPEAAAEDLDPKNSFNFPREPIDEEYDLASEAHLDNLAFVKKADEFASLQSDAWQARETARLRRQHKKLEDPLTAFFASIKMSDHAEKFKGMEDILKLKTRDLKEMGLTVKQRKTYLKLVDRYKAQMRANTALALIRTEGYSLTPAQLQSRVYEIMYGHVYESNDVYEMNAQLTRDWREPIEEHREKRLEEHNNFRGLREPELMEMAKLEATQIAAARDYIKSQLPTEAQLAKILARRKAEEFERRPRRKFNQEEGEEEEENART